MKKIILVLLGILSIQLSSSQVVLKIDSIDISRTTDSINIRYGQGVRVKDTISPRLKIMVTVENRTKKKIFLWHPGVFDGRGMDLEFIYRGNPYCKHLGWKNPGIGAHSFWLEPGKSRNLELWTYIPSGETQQPLSQVLHVVHPANWDWGKEEVADADYLEWFEAVLPTMRVIIHYGPDDKPRHMRKLESPPLDPETVVITSNLGDVLN